MLRRASPLTIGDLVLRPPLALTASLAVVALLAACGGGVTDNGSASGSEPSPTGVFAPTGEPSTLTPATPEGQTVELDGAGTIVVPEGSTSDGPAVVGEGTQQVLYRLPDADEEGVPAVQVTWGQDATGVYEQSWTSEQAAQVDQNVSDYVRSVVEWPGSAESVVATWSEDVPLTTGDVAVVDGMRLTVRTDDGVTVVVIALAREGELEGSAAVESLRSLSLG